MPDLSTPVINEDADRRLGRIILRFGVPVVILALLVPFGMSFINLDVPQNHLFKYHKLLDLLSLLIILIPFFIGINRLFAARLQMGREFVAQRRWREAIAALDPFAGIGQRFLDGTGEAHYLLAQAYTAAGQSAKAGTIRGFVLRHRPGQWADRINAAPTRPTPKITPKVSKTGQEKAPRPANRKPRRRF